MGRGGCGGLSLKMCFLHRDTSSAILCCSAQTPLHALLLCSETSPPTSCFPVGMHPYPCPVPPRPLPPSLLTCTVAVDWQTHPTLLTLLPLSFSDSALPETGRESPGVGVLVCHHASTLPCLVLWLTSWEEGAALITVVAQCRAVSPCGVAQWYCLRL